MYHSTVSAGLKNDAGTISGDEASYTKASMAFTLAVISGIVGGFVFSKAFSGKHLMNGVIGSIAVGAALGWYYGASKNYKSF